MPKHKYFEQLCALAPLGNLPYLQQQELETHLAECDECRELSAEFLQVHREAIEPIAGEAESIIEAGRDRVKSEMWANIARADEQRSRVAVDESILGSSAVASTIFYRYRLPLWAGASAMAVAAVSFWIGTQIHRTGKPILADKSASSYRSRSRTSATNDSAPDNSKLELQGQVVKLTQSLAQGQQQIEALQKRLGTDDQELSRAVAAEVALQAEMERRNTAVKTTQAELDAKRAELEQAQSTNSSDGATIAGLQLQVHDLTSRVNLENASIERERDLLSYGRQVRDIIGARNLHVVDVYDMSAAGAIKKPFARAFYTEGQSLVYYAFDLPEGKPDKGRFSYVAWGENSRSGATVRKIGILFKDDQTQRRWSLNFSDPQVLGEIDSVFITLERTDENVAKPKGKRMLTAYLGTTPNHP
jgi:hypothetical protein